MITVLSGLLFCGVARLMRIPPENPPVDSLRNRVTGQLSDEELLKWNTGVRSNQLMFRCFFTVTGLVVTVLGVIGQIGSWISGQA
jgi:hypothetical protein